ncbi:hypothetical protein AGDE_14553 [Angomonas deanei]|uniref:Uncharacterized protein n=1 Tax=Angomonas deanei TaxID=59799 RepID=A0A7G2CBJ6_9TRYP|nr:hypothetical protein AGDE_14553 [Angomonas deanei]CAD2216451.1 hypothetical protein, conserved [Angomonas deanei]|eukprot:EPY20656.1 hypothetical protein AGDE_14553 [Angomonas deanei]
MRRTAILSLYPNQKARDVILYSKPDMEEPISAYAPSFYSSFQGVPHKRFRRRCEAILHQEEKERGMLESFEEAQLLYIVSKFSTILQNDTLRVFLSPEGYVRVLQERNRVSIISQYYKSTRDILVPYESAQRTLIGRQESNMYLNIKGLESISWLEGSTPVDKRDVSQRGGLASSLQPPDEAERRSSIVKEEHSCRCTIYNFAQEIWTRCHQHGTTVLPHLSAEAESLRVEEEKGRAIVVAMEGDERKGLRGAFLCGALSSHIS